MELTPTILPSAQISLPASLSSGKRLRIGRGISHAPAPASTSTSTPASKSKSAAAAAGTPALTATLVGTLRSDVRKHSLWVEPFGRGGRYMPAPNDHVIGTALRSNQDFTTLQLSPHTPSVTLPVSNFESSSKKLRPQIAPGDLVYARICPPESSLPHVNTTAAASNKLVYDGVEASCVSATTGKADGLGPLKGGMVFDVSLRFAGRLIRGGAKNGSGVLEILGEKVEFECVVGRNGRVWVKSENVRVVLLVGRVVRRVDELEGQGKDVSGEQQRRIVDEIARKLAA